MPKGRARANGEGSIFHRQSDDRWVAELIVGWKADGKRDILRHSAATRRDVAAWLAERVKERNDGTLVQPSKQTVERFLTDWIDHSVAHAVNESTIALYRNVFAWYLKPHVGHLSLAELKPQHIQNCYHTIMEAGRSARTVQIAHTILRKGLAQKSRE